MKKFCLLIIALGITLTVVGQEVKPDSSYLRKSDAQVKKDQKPEYDKVNYESYFIPGLGYSYYVPKGSDSTGNFHGIAVNYLIYSKMYQNNKPGPSIVRFYSKLSIMKSSEPDINDIFCYSLGLSFSFEKNPKRTILVPYFGLEFGGLSQSQWGTTGQFTPTLGIHFVARRNMYVNLQGGYVYPITNFDILQGLFLEAGINFALW